MRNNVDDWPVVDMNLMDHIEKGGRFDIRVFLWTMLIAMALSALMLFTTMFFCEKGFCLEVQRDKNVATYIVFPLIDSSDDVSYKSSATSPDSEIDAWADGSAPDGFADCTNEATEIGSTGVYYLSLEQGETNYDYIIIQVKASDANTQAILINTKPKEAIDAIAGYVDTEVSDILTDTAAMDTSSELRTLLCGSDTAISTLTAANVWETNISAYSGAGYAGTYLKNLYDNQGDWATAVGFSTHAAADVWAVGTRTLTALDEDGTTIDLDGSTIGTVTSVSNGVTVTTNNDKTGYALSAAGVDAVWDEVITGHSTADSFGKVFDDQIDGLRTYGDSNWLTATGFSTHAAADVWSVETRSLTILDEDGTTIDLDGSTVGGLTTWDKAGYALSAAGIDAIWDEAQSGHTSAGTFGKYLDAQVSTVGGGTAADIADAVWDEAIADHADSGSTGEALTNASAAGNPWETDISTGYDGKAGEYMRNVYNSTDGDKESGEYTGIEKLIRISR